MLTIEALPAFNDNYIWLLQDHRTQRCAVVDPGDATPVQHWLAQHPEWSLTDILITHHHHDHVDGVKALKAQTQAQVYGPALENIPARDVAVHDEDHFTLWNYDVRALHVPGHTKGHVAYVLDHPEQPWLFCGDTLFAAGCGRLFEGTPEQMHTSLQRLAALPDNTLVFCTHEYTQSNLNFALAAEPNNLAVQKRLQDVRALREQGLITLPSNIALERITNPFLRCNQPELIGQLQQQERFDNKDIIEIFAALRRWKNRF